MRKTTWKMAYRSDILNYAAKQYGTEPDYPWAYLPGYAALRHQDNRKWYALIMDIPRSKLGLPGNERVDILNVKLDDPLLVDLLIQQAGYLRYHAGRGNWISVLLDGSVPLDDVCGLIDKSFLVTASTLLTRPGLCCPHRPGRFAWSGFSFKFKYGLCSNKSNVLFVFSVKYIKSAAVIWFPMVNPPEKNVCL